MWLRFSSFALASPQLRPSHALGLGETGATLRSARAGGFAAVKAATCLSGDDLVGTCAAGTGLCPAGRRFIGTKGFASVIKALGMHPIADLAIANWTGLFVIWMKMPYRRAGTPIAAKAFEVASALLAQIVLRFGFFCRSYHYSQTPKSSGFHRWFSRPLGHGPAIPATLGRNGHEGCADPEDGSLRKCWICHEQGLEDWPELRSFSDAACPPSSSMHLL